MTSTTKRTKTTPCKCTICGAADCLVDVYTEDGEVTKVLPNKRWPNSMRGCTRMHHEGRAAIEYHYHQDRLNFPMKRLGDRGSGQWERISWEQAIGEVAEKLTEIKGQYGAEAVAALGGTAHYPDYTWTKALFMNCFGSPNNGGNEQVCFGPYTKACETTLGYDSRIGMDPRTMEMLIVSSNFREHAAPSADIIPQLKAAGCKIISLNPEFETTSAYADAYLPLRPGTDGAFYMSMMNVIIEEDLYDHDFVSKWVVGFEKLREAVKTWTPEKAQQVTWISASTIREVAIEFAKARVAGIYETQCLDGQAPNGFNAIRSLLCCLIITGNVDKALYLGSPYPNTHWVDEYEIERDDLLPKSMYGKQIGGRRFRVLGHDGWDYIGKNQDPYFNTRMFGHSLSECHHPTMWRQILSEKPYPVKAIILSGCGALTKYANPKLVYEAFKKLDLLVVLDFFHTPNTEMADYIFPMSDWMERPILSTLVGHHLNMMSGSVPAVDPMYERRSDFDFFRALSVELGLGEYWPWETLQECYDYRLARQGLTLEQFCEQKMFDTLPLRPGQYEDIDPTTGKVRGFPTPTGKIEVESVTLKDLGYDAMVKYEEPNFSPVSTPEYYREYPFILVTGRRVQPYFHSEHRMINSLRKIHPDPIVMINPEDSQFMDPPVVDGDWVWLETHLGRVKQRARITTAIPRGVVSAEHNWWFPEDDARDPSLFGVWKSNINVLLDDDPDLCDVHLGIYTNKNALCKVYRA